MILQDCSGGMLVSQWIRSPRKFDLGQIRYASDFDPTLTDLIRINNAIVFLLSTSQSDLWCIYADLTYYILVYKYVVSLFLGFP